METYGSVSLREAFGEALREAGAKYPDIRVLDAGTRNSTMSELFQKVYPDRFYTAGINEPGMIGLATGLAMAGKRVVACDMSVFLQHAYAHLFTAARQGEGLHLIIAASHTGVAVGPDGGSAHDITDLARMRLIPNFIIITPWDGHQTKSALDIILAKPGYYYIRLNRPKVPIFLPQPAPFEIGKAYLLREGSKLTLIALGDKVFTALQAAEELGAGVADVIGISTLEPLDGQTIIASAHKTAKVITIEDHSEVGGLFESVAGVLVLEKPVPMRKVSVERVFTTSGEPDELARIYKVDLQATLETCRIFL
ncbi:MAG: transketolase family protein [Calditrichaeota bacterium]|nr:transketolase family protein [Calditrichota bacterium]